MILIALIINSLLIPLVPDITTNPTTIRDGYANVQMWEEGTLVYAHNYLSGGLFYDIDSVSAVYSDGSVVPMKVKQRMIYTSDWDETLTSFSDLSTITLATCYPEVGTSSWRLLIELEPEEESVSIFRTGDAEGGNEIWQIHSQQNSEPPGTRSPTKIQLPN